MPARTAAPILETLSTAIPKAFEQAQTSTANHQKNFVALHKIQIEAATKTESVRNGEGLKLVGERAFEDCFLDMINRVLVVKKGTAVGDRIVKFVGGYIRFLNAKAVAEGVKKEENEQQEAESEEEETTSTRFTLRLLKHFLKGFTAKDKNVRYRVVHFVAEMISHLGELDEEMYKKLRTALLERIRDKESTVRVPAVIALAKLCGTENEDELEEGEPTVSDALEDILAHDPSADVRRAALLNILVSPTSLSALLARTRDVDTTIRKLVYSAVLEPNCFSSIAEEERVVGHAHPRALTIAQRELIVRNGLGDREPTVRAAAGKLVGAWVDAVGGGKGMVGEDMIAFLEMFDLGEGSVAEDALLSVFVTRVDLFDGLEFDDDYWKALTPEKAFLVRVYVDHCTSTKDDSRLDSVLPLVTGHAFLLQERSNALLKKIAEDDRTRLLDDDESAARKEEQRIEQEFVIAEMLRLAVNLDFGDEIGRRKMEWLVRDMLSKEALPDSLVSRCLDVLRLLSSSERDLIRIVVEIVHELRDPTEEEAPKDPEANDDADTTFGDTPAVPRIRTRPVEKDPAMMSAEERERADAIDMRCLDLCIGMLERVNGTFEENSTLEGILGELIVPAVKRKELVLREKGLICLGLCCLIARRMALGSFQLFLGQVQAAPEVLKIRVLQVVFDVLMVHEGDFLAKASVGGDRVIEFLLQVLNNEESEKVQALLCMGFAKLMLSGMIVDERVLSSLVLIYLAPDTVDNQELRQCLSYFFPVYCYSSPRNQHRMKEVFVPIYEQLAKEYRELEEDQEMVTPAQMCGMFVDWTDPQKAVEIPGQTADPLVHVDFATTIIKALYHKDMEKDDKKVLCQVLSKLYIPPEVDDDKIRTLKLLMHNLHSRRPLRDSAANTAFTKFDNSISKKFEKQLEDFDEAEYRQLESLKDLFEFLDDIIPDDDEEEVELPKKRATRKRRSESVATDAQSTADEGRTTPAASRRKGKGRAKRPRLSHSDEDEEEEQDVGSPPTSAAPTRAMPRRAATKKVVMKPIVLEGDTDEDEEEEDDDDEDEDEEATPVPRRRPKASRTREAPPEDGEDDDLAAPEDSIMDSDEDEDEEVEGVLDAL
ncbi:hypothetical protein BV25DRAFT_1823946 [Artomyces pyxidatus]|uniref:Uncharacterized protein n=1 Tax=Artomyces pyxidatus TaxID=48021 RepID=A0ACB8T6L7_9AGAM|nr:hypothetical protein BV25DRAFT_1823946 [Artomyces pyxidatus]